LKRDLPRLASTKFDLLVIGGGIYGLAIAYDAALRGLSVALVDRGDFGAATSFNHLKTVHGGLRYLQSADLARMREAVRERRAFARIAPRYVAPLAFVLPASNSITRNALALQIALSADALIAFDRNRGLDVAHRLPAGHIVSRSACAPIFEGTGLDGISAAARWHDYVIVEGERLTLAFALAAARHDAVLANYVEAIQLLTDKGRAGGARVKDLFTGNVFDVQARVTVNAAGPWTAPLLKSSGIGGQWPMLKAMNLVTSRPARRAAIVAPMNDGRALVLLPWRGRTIVGTSESTDPRQAHDQGISRGEIDTFINQVNATFPSLSLRSDEVTLVHRGIVPGSVRADGRLTLRSHSRIVDHEGDGISRLISVVGVKYTTARAVAERAVNMVGGKLARRLPPCRTAEVVLPTAGSDDRAPLDPIRHAVEEEMARTLVDVVARRTGAGAAGYPGDDIVGEYASAMQPLLGWSLDKTAAEIAALRKFYEISG
jgi:glycerol-3-phosphate dehydrogenase